jgi:hypothetical protein
MRVRATLSIVIGYARLMVRFVSAPHFGHT